MTTTHHATRNTHHASVLSLSCVSCISWCLSFLLLSPAPLLASPSSALREYKAVNYDHAHKQYERLLQKKTDDPRLHFNAGAAAYRNRQFDEAAKQFNATLAAPDLKLQGLAYYNEGNSLYHLGENLPDPQKRNEAWQKALADYQSALKLNPQDADARHNYDFVKKRLEELKQQQPQSQQNKQDQKQDQDQQRQDQNKQQQQDQQKQQDQQQQQQQAQQDQKQDQKQQPQPDQQKKEQEQQQAAQQPQPEKQDQQQAQPSSAEPKDQSGEKEQQAAAAQDLAQMTPDQARKLLDAQKGDEQMLPLRPAAKPQDRTAPIKDW